MVYPFASPLLGIKQGAQYIAGGVGNAGVSIPLAASAAAVGDLILVFSPHGGIPTLGGAGWTTWTDNYAGGGYDTGVSWKVITSTADVTISGDDQGHAWIVWRNVRSVARNAFVFNNLTVTFATLGGSAAGLAILASTQTGALSAATVTGFRNRVNGYHTSMRSDILDTSPDPAAAGARTIGVYSATANQQLTAIELRN